MCDKRLVGVGAVEEESGCLLQAAAGVEQLVFAGDFDSHAKAGVRVQELGHLIGEVMRINDDFVDSE